MPKIMKLSDVGSSDAEVEYYLSNPEWMLQQKFDGTRIQAQWDPESETILFSNSGEGPVTHSAAKLKLPALEAELRPMLEAWILPVTLEGELLIRTGEFLVWDILEGSDPERWPDTFTRTSQLQEHLSGRWSMVHQFRLVKPTPTAYTESEKREMWERINVAGVEGAVSKHQASRYEPGIRSTQWVKHKLVKTADLVVIAAAREFKPEGVGRPANSVVHKGSAALGFYKEGLGIVPIAAASLIGRDLTIDPGDVVEVAFLYREPGGGLVQPRILCKRWDALSGTGDKPPPDCTEDQFAPYSREVV